MKRAEYAALLKRQCGWKPSRKWSCEPPPEDEIARFGCFPDGEAIGPRAIVETAPISADPAARAVAAGDAIGYA
jgi:allantoin racemase